MGCGVLVWLSFALRGTLTEEGGHRCEIVIIFEEMSREGLHLTADVDKGGPFVGAVGVGVPHVVRDTTGLAAALSTASAGLASATLVIDAHARKPSSVETSLFKQRRQPVELFGVMRYDKLPAHVCG